jgi:vacuolar-type H+-ATPase subunit E/Vma4
MSEPLLPAPEEARRLEHLARIVAEDVLSDLHRDTDRATNEARRLVAEAEQRALDLAAAAGRLGQARGMGVGAATLREAEREAAAVTSGALGALRERFAARVRLALQALPGTPRHAQALATWAREAAQRMDRPADVYVEGAHRAALYDALLAAGARDFRVHADPRVHVGFVVRDLDGRTLIDRRPEALLEERREALDALLAARLPAPPPPPP